MRILFGTTNEGKFRRMKAILKELPINLVSLNDLNLILDIEETGKDTLENSIIKARAFYDLARIPTFSIDSGLYIDKFPVDKNPGPFVRRIVSNKATDEEMMDYYISELDKVGGTSSARWIDSISIVLSDNVVISRNFTEETFLTSNKSPVYIKGEPLSSIQIDPTFKKYKSEITYEERSSCTEKFDNDMKNFFNQILKTFGKEV